MTLYCNAIHHTFSLRAYHFLQLTNLLLLVMNLLVLHLQNILQTLQVFLNMLIWGQGVLEIFMCTLVFVCIFMTSRVVSVFWRDLPQSVHRCFSSEPLRNVWLCPSGFGSGMSECPPGPERASTFIN